MSAVGNARSTPGGAAADDHTEPGLWGSFGGGLRLLVGWFSVAIALLNLLVEVEQLPDRAYLLFHAILLAGGFLLISLRWSAAGTGPVGYAAGGSVLAGGMLLSAVPPNDTVCCLTGFAVRHGYPFTFVARHDSGRWHFDSQHVLADLLFWGYAGLIALVLVAVTHRVRHHGEARDRPARSLAG